MPNQTLAQGLYWVSIAIAIGSAIATLLGFLGTIAWPFTLLDHLWPLDSQGSALLQRRSEGQTRTPATIDIISTQVNAFPSTSTRPILSAEVNWQGQEMSILSLHVTRPRNASTARFQQIELEAIAQWVQTTQTPSHSVIILGDFNSTPWSQIFRTFQRQSGLSLARQGWGLKPTWPAWLPPFLQIPIDCGLHSPSLTPAKYQVGPNLGSDHRPIKLQIRRLS